MSRHRTLRGLVRDLGRAMDLRQLELDEDGTCALSFDDRVVLHIATAESAGMAMLYAPLGAIADERRIELHRRMLAANFIGAAGNVTLGLDDRGDPVLLCHARVENLAYPEFERLVEQFVATAETWIREVRAPAPAAQRPVLESGWSHAHPGIRA